MNNKLKYLVLSGTLATMLMGAGYASWTDRIDVQNTVKTGHLDVHFVDQGTGEDGVDNALDLATYVTGDVTYSNLSDNPANTSEQNRLDKANVIFENMYPGASSRVTLKIANNSTIPVEMRAIRDTVSENWGARGENFNQIGACVQFFNADGTAIPDMKAETSQYANPWSPSELANAELPVGGYALIDFTFTAADAIDEESTYTFSPYAVFQQFNDLNSGSQNVDEHAAGIVDWDGESNPADPVDETPDNGEGPQ